MKRHDLLSAARFVLELVLAIPGCEAAFAMDIDVPPAVICHLVIRPHAVAASATEMPDGDPQHGSEAAQPAVIVHPLLDCRVQEPGPGPATVRRAVEDGTHADVAAR